MGMLSSSIGGRNSSKRSWPPHRIALCASKERRAAPYYPRIHSLQAISSSHTALLLVFFDPLHCATCCHLSRKSNVAGVFIMSCHISRKEPSMLVLRRKVGESIVLGGIITITV